MADPVPARVGTLAASTVSDIAVTLRRARRARRWSLDKLAAYSGVGRHTILLLEGGKRAPSVELVARLTRALDMNLVLTSEETPTSPATFFEQVEKPSGERLFMHVICQTPRWGYITNGEQHKPTYCVTCHVTTNMWEPIYARIATDDTIAQ